MKVIRNRYIRNYNIKIGAMIGTKNILAIWVKLSPVLNLKREKDENKHQSRPPSVDDSNPFEFSWKDDRNEQWNEKD